MNELDKYFDKARKSKPILEEGEAKKILAGKLSDGGIATNLYNKIKVYPMITTLITSVATIATIALLTVSSPNKVKENTSSPKQTSAWQTNSVNLEPNNTELIEPNEQLMSAKYEETEEAKKVDKTTTKPRQTWTEDNNIDIKTVNTLKLNAEQLSELGITIENQQFKVNAFDKYQYVIFKNNDKRRDYYNEEENQNALPTPAMVTTATGFKTLTLFKRGNVEAIVDRHRSKSDDGVTEQTISSTEYNTDKKFNIDFIPDNAPNFDIDGSYDDYKKSLSGRRDSAEIISEIEKFESMELEVNGKKLSLDLKKILKDSKSLNGLSSMDIEKYLDIKDGSLKLDENSKNMKLSMKIRKSDEDDAIDVMDIDYDVRTDDLNENQVKLEREVKDLLFRSSDSTKFIELKSIVKHTDNNNNSSTVSNKDVNLFTTDINDKDVQLILKTSLDSIKGKKTTLVEVEDNGDVSETDNPNNRTIRIPIESLGKNKKIKIIDGEEVNPNKDVKLKLINRFGLEKLEYNINELIPIEISFDGETSDFIVWYEATDDFLSKLPASEMEKINPELLALVEQKNHCENEPIEKGKTVMDVWSGCSGAIKEMRVFPNPANSSSNVEFELEENRVLSISVYDLSGKLIKKIQNGLSFSKGQIAETLNLNGINPGLYYVVVKSDKNEQALQRIIIE